MDLKTTRKVTLALAAVSMLFLLLAYGTVNAMFVNFAVVSAAALVGVILLFWRCPHCGEHLGRDVSRYCTHCGKELDL
ncbi:MAG: zinc ribbon domain-containing protein [Oscillibacter sp.]|nr:zinc ribbon domain-containing protein [Oscillibacter sp.]